MCFKMLCICVSSKCRRERYVRRSCQSCLFTSANPYTGHSLWLGNKTVSWLECWKLNVSASVWATDKFSHVGNNYIPPTTPSKSAQSRLKQIHLTECCSDLKLHPFKRPSSQVHYITLPANTHTYMLNTGETGNLPLTAASPSLKHCQVQLCEQVKTK